MSDALQVQPPPIPPWFLPRPRLFALLQGALDHRLTTVSAGPGWGKSTILSAWGLAMGCVWYTAGSADSSVSTLARGLVSAFRRRLPALDPGLEGAMLEGHEAEKRGRSELLAGLICEALDPIAPDGLPVVIDAGENLGMKGGAARLVEAMCRQAPMGVHVLLASRTAPPGVLDRLARRGGVLAIGADDLAFSLEETGDLVAATVGRVPPEVLQELHARTGGWPAAVRLAVEALSVGPATSSPGERDILALAGATRFSRLADEALRRQPPEVLALLSRMSQLERFTTGLCEALGIPNARRMLDGLARRGLFVQHQGGPEEWLSVHILLREYADERCPIPPDERRATMLRAAEWFEGRRNLGDALLALRRSGDVAALGRFLSRNGWVLLAEAGGAQLVEAADLVPPEDRDARLETILGWARRIRGEWGRAFEHYERAAAGCDRLPAGLAWRMAEAHYLRSELPEAAAVATRADLATASDYDRSMLLTWYASALRRQGDRERALPLAVEAREIAERSRNPELIAASVTTELGILDLPDSNPLAQARDAQALEASERSDNLWLRIRFLTNRAEALVKLGRGAEGITMVETALRLSESSGDPFSIGRTLEVRAMLELGQGRLAQAVDDARHSRTMYERAGSYMTGQAWLVLGHAHRQAGELSAALEAYRHALGTAQATGNADVTQEALCGEVRLAAVADPAQARRISERALGMQGTPRDLVCETALAAGWAALFAGDPDLARQFADRASDVARVQTFRPLLAEALELAAMAAPTPDMALLGRARDLWAEAGNRVGRARVEVAMATLAHPSGESGPDLAAAVRRLEALGVRLLGAEGAAGLLAALPRATVPPVEVRTLGGFAIRRAGLPVPLSAWRSRKARDLLKILVARRGAPVSRDALAQTLWPGDPVDVLSNRLSVALAILRQVLDPTRAFGLEHFVSADDQSVRLIVGRFHVDVERFLASAAEGLRPVPSPPTGWSPSEEDVVRLEAAEAMYSGEFLEEDIYEDWASPLREEAKTRYIEVCRVLAAIGLRPGRHDDAIRFGLRVLGRDPYDEIAHVLVIRALVAAGRHGEARRRYRVYVAALDEIGVGPSPYPGASRESS